MDYWSSKIKNQKSKIRLIVTGGGTGGHILPALAFYEEFISEYSENDILYVGRKNSIEEKLVTQNSFNFKYIPSAALAKGKLAFLFIMSIGILKSMVLIIKGNYDVVLGFGGYTAFPALFAGLLLRKNVVVHESNVVPGKVVRFLARMGAAVAYGFESCGENLKGIKNICFTGTPVRKRFFNYSKEDGLEISGLKPEFPIIMIIGGSQGSRFLNNNSVKLINEIKKSEKNIQVVHITGIDNEFDFNKEYSLNNINSYSVPFSNDVGALYKIADVVVARAGALTVTELLISKTPAVLVPLPTAAENHQFKNAETLKEKNLAVIVQEDNFKIIDTAEIIIKLLNKKNEQLDDNSFFINAASKLLNFVVN